MTSVAGQCADVAGEATKPGGRSSAVPGESSLDDAFVLAVDVLAPAHVATGATVRGLPDDFYCRSKTAFNFAGCEPEGPNSVVLVSVLPSAESVNTLITSTIREHRPYR